MGLMRCVCSSGAILDTGKMSANIKHVQSEPRKRVTLRDIARHLKLSHATVSMALRDHPAIASSTRTRVAKAASKLGYRVEPMLSALASYRQGRRPPTDHGTLAWINCFENPRDLYSEYLFKDYLSGAKKRAEQRGYRVEEFPLHQPGMTMKRLLGILKARGIQGVILPPQPEPKVIFEEDFADFAVVTFGFSVASPRFHRVCNAQNQSAMLAFECLRELGYRRIGLLASHGGEERVAHNFHSGYLVSLKRFPDVEEVPIYWEPEDLQQREKTMIQWFKRYRPDVVFGMVVPHFVPALERAGIKVPQEIAIASLSCTNDNPQYAGIDQKGKETGEAAIDVLVDAIQTGTRGAPPVARYVLIEGEWRNGETAPPRREGKPKRRKKTAALS